jgi:hypothetical protein
MSEQKWHPLTQGLIGQLFQIISAHKATTGGSGDYYIAVLESIASGIRLSEALDAQKDPTELPPPLPVKREPSASDSMYS